MSYLINRYDGSQLVVLEDGTLDTSTSLGLLGRNYTGYGEVQNENFLFLLENFSNNSAPLRPISGQLWFNSDTGALNIYDGNNWRTSAVAEVSNTPPTAVNGSFWFDTNLDQVKVYFNNEWYPVGPESAEGFGVTKASSTTLRDDEGINRPVILITIDDVVIGIITNAAFTLSIVNPITGFTSLINGLNLLSNISGNIQGNASTATRLETPRNINGVAFTGLSDITIRSSTTQSLTPGDYISGSVFDGSIARTWNIRASSDNTVGSIVARDSGGDFSAGTITANLVGNVSGNVTATSGTSTFKRVIADEFIGASLSGNAYSATRLQTARKINGVDFNGSADITISAAASTLTGTELSSSVVTSHLTRLGILDSLVVADSGVTIGTGLTLYSDVDSQTEVVKSASTGGLEFNVSGSGDPNLDKILVISNSKASLVGAESKVTMIPKVNGSANIGTSSYRFNKIYSNNLDATTINSQTINTTSGDNNLTITSNLIISGNLVVNGNTTTINSTQVAVEDLLFTVAKGSTNPSSANGAGLYVEGALAELTYSATGDKWTINKPLDAGTNNITTTGLFIGTATSARYADLAENYTADAAYEPGTVVEIGGEKEVTIASEETTRVAGIVSTNPAYLMNSELYDTHVVPVALQGRVPCCVVGPIKRGDMLVSAGNGRAKAKENPNLGTVIGKALQDFNGTMGTIEVVVGRL